MSLLGSQQAEDFSTSDDSKFDWQLVAVTIAIMCVGLVNIYSVSSSESFPTADANFLLRQMVFMVVGLGIIVIGLFFDYRIIDRIAYLLYLVNLVALSLVPLIGTVRYGAKRWLDLKVMTYQPSETMKFATILALAKYFQGRNSLEKMDFKDLIVPGLIVAVPGLLTIAQPDLGTGGHLIIAGATILLFVGIRTRVLVTAALIAVVSFPVVWKYGMKPYQQDRIRTFLDPMQDPKGQGYNALQSMIAVGSGQVFGKGFTRGTQTQLDFTPEGHTDFIFTVLAEEWGLIGCLFLFGLYLYLFRRCVRIAARARDKFGSLAAVGIIGMLSSQIAINVSMVSGMFPVVGIPLPLVSYGGTSIVTVCLALAIILNVGYRRTIF